MSTNPKEYMAAWREAHATEVRTYFRAYRAEHKEQIREYHKRYQLKHASREDRERRTDQFNNLRAKRLGVFVLPVARAEIYERDHGRCGICGQAVAREEMEIDHIVPLTQGGLHEPTNVQVAHVHCNRRKSKNEGLDQCSKGHPFDAANTRIDKRTGWRSCRLCHQEWTRQSREKKRQAAV